ncbi:WXG100 family type VII secretion target [Amycolatopsis sp. NPDC058986]|uniref:WXG100 family type VII secretion target n=1 Tax=unclassified Amycolatopsis TaxID=2618356 RepID=UPI0036729B36
MADVDAGQIQAFCGRDIGAAENTIKAELTRIEGALNDLAAKWGGEAAHAFRAAMDGFFQDTRTITNALTELQGKLRASAANYTKSENAAREAAVALPGGGLSGI